MHLAVGDRLGPYEVLAIIGAGGMGEVYKARDTRLDRIVAIKILPSADSEAKARFDREAKAIAAVTHPRICRLYDVGHDGGTDYLVMEFVDGETLAARLRRGPLTVSDALTNAIQIADGLDCAHRAGIVHRDLKPANIMLTRGGVKLLDFGLAKLQPTSIGFESSGAVPTATSTPVTALGTVIGTLPYMAPEQLESRDVDPRTDIWAFGCVLYEMLTGKPAFAGNGPAALVGSIMHDAPPMPALPAAGGRPLVRVVEQCLAKAREERLQSSHDVRALLDLIAEGTIGGARPRVASRGRYAILLVAGVAAAAVVAAGFWFERSRRPDAAQDPLSVSIVPTSRIRVAPSPVPLAMSPDGRALAYVGADTSGIAHLWYRPLDDRVARMLPETDGASEPFFSPDGTRVGFFADGSLKTISVSAGTPQTLAPAVAPFGGTWGPDDTILFCPSPAEGILAINGAGGRTRRVAGNVPGRGFRLFSGPVFLPDGHFLYGSIVPQPVGDPKDPTISVASLDGRVTRPVLMLGSNVAYSAGFLLYLRGDSLVAQPFDLHSLAVKGTPTVVADRIQVGSAARGAFAASTNGRIAYVAVESNTVDPEWRDRSGRLVSTVKVGGELFSPAISPDGHWLVGQRLDPATRTTQLWSYNLARGGASRLTEGASNTSAVWSSDGSRVLYAALRRDQRVIEWQAVNRTTQPEAIAAFGEDVIVPESLTADGRFLSFTRTDPNTQSDIWVLPLTGDRKPQPIVNTTAAELQSRFAPDGRWIAYSSNASGQWQVFVEPFPVTGQKWQVSVDGGADPQWRRDSRELFYLRPDRMLMAVSVTAEPRLTLSVPLPLFVTPTHDLVSERNHYVVARDGQRFLFTGSSADESAAAPITLLVNWPSQPVRKE